MRPKLKIAVKFHTFSPAVKFRGGVGEISERIFCVRSSTQSCGILLLRGEALRGLRDYEIR